MKRNKWIRRWIAVLAAAALCLSGMGFAAAEEAPLPELPEGVRPVTWEVSPDHLMIETEEARALYEQITAGDYPTMEELKVMTNTSGEPYGFEEDDAAVPAA